MTLTTGPFSPGLRRSVGVVMIGASLSFLDSTIVNVALHTLSAGLHAGLGTVQWMVTAYLLALAAVIPVTGWASRRFGAARLYVAALAVFTIGSVLCACSQGVGMLIASRALQGAGGGAIMPVGTGRARRRGRAGHGCHRCAAGRTGRPGRLRRPRPAGEAATARPPAVRQPGVHRRVGRPVRTRRREFRRDDPHAPPCISRPSAATT
jgi:Major Facilitator Superfamily